MVISLWVVFIGMAVWQWNTTRQLKISRLQEQLDMINSRIVDAYESGDNNLVHSFLDFADRYYKNDTIYESIRISTFLNGVPISTIGEPIILTEEDRARVQGLLHYGEHNPNIPVDPKRYIYYKVNSSSDGIMQVATILPFDNNISDEIRPNLTIYFVMFGVALFLTIITFVASRHLTKNIRILRSVAEKAATDPQYIPMTDFPHDELGDINRQIVHLYNELSHAINQQKREHAIALNSIEEKARVKRQLNSNINHELRTPISVIRGYLDTIVENPDMDPATQRHFIKKAQEHAMRLISLINDVSSITRLEEGSEVINTEELNFHDIVFKLNDDLEQSKVLGDMKFSFDVPINCNIQGNINLLTAMLMNLARNAAAYSKGTECGIKTLAEDEEGYTFSFWDNGRGVGEEHIPHLFERFYRVDSGRARKAGGTGLGLPIVKSTVMAHGGSIIVQNREGGGLEFIFNLVKPGKLKNNKTDKPV